LVSDSAAKATPLQRRSIDDATRRLQTLTAQLASHSLSEPVTGKLLALAQQLQAKAWPNALHSIHELTTNHFAETGGWVLGLRRLVELQQQHHQL
jgi:hypothetical protein